MKALCPQAVIMRLLSSVSKGGREGEEKKKKENPSCGSMCHKKETNEW